MRTRIALCAVLMLTLQAAMLKVPANADIYDFTVGCDMDTPANLAHFNWNVAISIKTKTHYVQIVGPNNRTINSVTYDMWLEDDGTVYDADSAYLVSETLDGTGFWKRLAHLTGVCQRTRPALTAQPSQQQTHTANPWVGLYWTGITEQTKGTPSRTYYVDTTP